MSSSVQLPLVAIACGGTGGHLFPGLAVGAALARQGAALSYLVSTKEVDQRAVRGVSEGTVEAIEGVGLEFRRPWRFLVGLWRAVGSARASFRRRRPDAVLAMGGFTAVAPVWVARRFGLPIFLHDSNVVPGRASRWMARWVHTAFLGFPEALGGLKASRVLACGTPVRASIRPMDPIKCREMLGLELNRPTLLVTGGSQGAHGVNRLVVEALPTLAQRCPDLQYLHLTGASDWEATASAYRRCGRKALVRGFTDEMECFLGAADVVISRAGGSSLAELAAMRVAAILVPYPAATDDHQLRNAQVVADTGGARLCEQGRTTPIQLAQEVIDLLRNPEQRRAMGTALGARYRPAAAVEMAEVILGAISERSGVVGLSAQIEGKGAASGAVPGSMVCCGCGFGAASDFRVAFL